MSNPSHTAGKATITYPTGSQDLRSSSPSTTTSPHEDGGPRHRADWGPLGRISHWMARPLAQLRAQVKAPEGLSHRRLMAWVASVAGHT